MIQSSPVDHDVESVGNEPLHRPQVAVNGQALVAGCGWDVGVAAAGLADVRQGHRWGGCCLADGAPVLGVDSALRQLLQGALVRAIACEAAAKTCPLRCEEGLTVEQYVRCQLVAGGVPLGARVAVCAAPHLQSSLLVSTGQQTGMAA